jgi:ATP-dependent Zn protease
MQVERWGMSDKVGYVSHKSRGGGGRGGGGGEVSEETRAAIDAEVVNDEF